MFYVYVLESSRDGKLYIGYTNDLKRRIAEHDEAKGNSTRYRLPLNLVYYEAYASQTDAKNREFRLKNSVGAYTALKRRITESLR